MQHNLHTYIDDQNILQMSLIKSATSIEGLSIWTSLLNIPNKWGNVSWTMWWTGVRSSSDLNLFMTFYEYRWNCNIDKQLETSHHILRACPMQFYKWCYIYKYDTKNNMHHSWEQVQWNIQIGCIAIFWNYMQKKKKKHDSKGVAELYAEHVQC